MIRAHGDALERVAWGYVDNAPDREDLMQEILMALWRALPRFRGESSLRTFVLQVAHNRSITFATRRRRFEDLPEEGLLPDPAPLVEERLIEAQDRDRLFRAIRRLPEAQRQAVMLHLEGLSQREIAALQETSEGSVGVRLTRARKALLARLVESAVAAAAILITAAALRHAGNPFEAALGLVVGASIGVLWIGRIRLRDREDAGVARTSPGHLAVLESVRRQEVRLAHFIWIVLPLELAFLTPWWVIGSRVHHRSLTDPGSWLTVWLPIVGMVALFVWSLRLRGRARAALRAIARLRDQFNSAERGE